MIFTLLQAKTMSNSTQLGVNVNTYFAKLETLGSSFSLELWETKELSDEEKEFGMMMASCDQDDDMCHDEYLTHYHDL